MSQYILTLLEVGGIQEYVFGSNELVQNIGASERVMQATGEWLFDALDRADIPHNVERRGGVYQLNFETGQYPLRARDILDGCDAEIIYAGGGKALLLFRNAEQKKQFVNNLTEHALLDAPDLQLVIASNELDWETKELWHALEDLQIEIEQRKANRPPSVPLIGLGVTAACAFTGLPAVDYDPTQERHQRTRLISSAVLSKIDARPAADKRLHELVPQVQKNNLEFVYDFDLLGTANQSSYLAVIHADGNRMGERFGNLAKDVRERNGPLTQRNAEYAHALRAFSKSISRASTKALRATIDALLSVYDSKEHLFAERVPAPSKRNKTKKPEYFVPFRPIVFGGDDVTFVCEGRLGLTVAEKYLATYSSEILSDGEPAHARAGITVVHTHYPFSRAYDLAQELCDSAKAFIKKRLQNATAMDWHFAISGLVRGLNEVRAREYHTSDGSLILRPYQLGEMKTDRRYEWLSFQKVIDEFSRAERWRGRRNKVKALGDALRAGPFNTEQFLEVLTDDDDKVVLLPEIPDRPTMRKRGWQGEECGYFDALEALEFYVPLEKGS